MTPRAGGFGESLERLLPFLTFVAIATAGWFWLIQPRFDAYLQARTELASLEERARTMQQVSARAQAQPPADLERTQREFEARMSADDEVAKVAAALAQTVLASDPAGRLRSFVIEAGDRAAPLGAADRAARASAAPVPDGADPRLALFPCDVSYTPLRVTFESTFEAAGAVLWRLRDLPTIVDVRSATLTRGLPLMKTELLVRVLQRGRAAAAVQSAPQMTLPAADVGGVR